MQILCEVIISILKLSKGEPISHVLVKNEARLPLSTTDRLLQRLQREKLVYVLDGLLQTSVLQRVGLAVRAIELGADYERVSGMLHWKEFENIAAVALEMHGYTVTSNVRFKEGGRRWEIDIVGCRKPLVVCADCKHWHHDMHPSSLKKIVEEQVERTRALAESLPNPAVKIECASWDSVRFIPTVLSLLVGRFKFYDNIPIVPVLQLQDFLDQLPAFADSLSIPF